MGKSALRQVVSMVIQLKRADDVATEGCRCNGDNPKRGPLRYTDGHHKGVRCVICCVYSLVSAICYCLNHSGDSRSHSPSDMSVCLPALLSLSLALFSRDSFHMYVSLSFTLPWSLAL
jgi:hypothetical protein